MGDGEAQIEVAIESMCIEARSADPMASTANVASSSVSTTKRAPTDAVGTYRDVIASTNW
jgi:hypothetical protein